MNYCLSKGDLEDFLKSHFSEGKVKIDDEYLNEVIDSAKNWESEVHLIIYFFSLYAQRAINSEAFSFTHINNFYELPNLGNFHYQIFDREFITYMFDHSRTRMKMNLEELLIKIQQDYSERNYASNFRY